MSITKMKVAAITEINKLDDQKDLARVLNLLSEISLDKQNNPSDLTQHYEIAKRRHKEILKELME
jgi:hypothetical protein